MPLCLRPDSARISVGLVAARAVRLVATRDGRADAPFFLAADSGIDAFFAGALFAWTPLAEGLVAEAVDLRAELFRTEDFRAAGFAVELLPEAFSGGVARSVDLGMNRNITRPC